MGNKLEINKVETNKPVNDQDEERPFVFCHGNDQYPVARKVLMSKSPFFRNLDHYSRAWEGSKETRPYALDHEMDKKVAVAFVALIQGDMVQMESKKELMQLLDAIDKYRVVVQPGKIANNFATTDSYDRGEVLKILRGAKHLLLYHFSAFDLCNLFRKSDREVLDCLTDEDVGVWLGHLLDANTEECCERVARAYATLDAKDLYEWSLTVERRQLIRACEALAKYRNVEPVAVRMDFVNPGINNKVAINGQDLQAYQMSILPYLDLIWIEDYKKDLLLNADISLDLFMAICTHMRHAAKALVREGTPEMDLVHLIGGSSDTLQDDKESWNDCGCQRRAEMLSIYAERCNIVMGVNFLVTTNDFLPQYVEGEVARVMSIISHGVDIDPPAYKQMLRVLCFYNAEVAAAQRRR